jgi:hypothetical protein
MQAMSTLKNIILFLIIFCTSCNDKNNRVLPLANRIDSKPTNKSEIRLSETAIKEKWDYLCSHDGCLTSGQYLYDGKFGSKSCVLTTDSFWIQFFAIPQRDLAAHLIGQIPDTAKTRIHTCPYQLASKGEIAIYCLQNIYKINFYDLTPQYSDIEKNIVAKFENEQNWIWSIQKSKEQTWELQRQWWIVFKEN